MGFRFRKSVKVVPGVRLNFSKSGVSTSIGGRGATMNVSKRGTRTTVGIPGTGLSHSSYTSSKKPKQNGNRSAKSRQLGGAAQAELDREWKEIERRKAELDQREAATAVRQQPAASLPGEYRPEKLPAPEELSDPAGLLSLGPSRRRKRSSFAAALGIVAACTAVVIGVVTSNPDGEGFAAFGAVAVIALALALLLFTVQRCRDVTRYAWLAAIGGWVLSIALPPFTALFLVGLLFWPGRD